MFWADRIAKEIQQTEAAKNATAEKPLLIRDEKTLSGRVHVGSMRGVAIHGLLAQVLRSYGIPTEFRYELNDFDPFDSIPGYLDEAEYTEHLGKPLYLVPSPQPGFENYAEFYGAEFVAVHSKAGFTADNYYRATELYKSGKMDPFIKTALERVDDIRRILKEVSGSVKDESWLPISVVCEKCQKMMTTRAYEFDGETVAYTCDKNPDGTTACGNSGRMSPYSGNSKLFWKVDWAAKWVSQGVEVEGGGKDHSTKGGSRDVANHIAKEIFGYQSPFDVPYEFFLVGGKKMSSSKGRGSSAKDMSDLFPSELLRLVLIGKDLNQQIDVDPEGDSVPRMYDWYDDLAQLVRDGVADDFTRLYELCHMPNEQAEDAAPWQLRFSQVSFMVQMPHLNLLDEAEKVKAERIQGQIPGAKLTEDERTLLTERADYARFWLNSYAPAQYVYKLQDTMPDVQLSDTEKQVFARLAEYMQTEHSGDDVQAYVYSLKDELPIQPKEIFAVIYKVFLNRESGPRAGWFLASLPRDYLLTRLQQAGQ